MYKIKYQQKTIINLNTRQLFFTFNLFLDYDRLHKRDKRHRMEPVRIILILLFPHTYTFVYAFESKTRVDSIVTINNATGDRRSREAEKDGERKRENRNGRVADDWKTGSSCAGKDVAERSRMSQFRVGRCTRLGSPQQRSFDFAHPGYVIRCSGNGISWFVDPLSRWILNSALTRVNAILSPYATIFLINSTGISIRKRAVFILLSVNALCSPPALPRSFRRWRNRRISYVRVTIELINANLLPFLSHRRDNFEFN